MAPRRARDATATRLAAAGTSDPTQRPVFWLTGQEAAVDDDRLPTHVARVRRGEEGDHRRHLVGLALSADGDPALEGTARRLGVTDAMPVGVIEGRVDPAGRHAVDPHRRVAEADRQ